METVLKFCSNDYTFGFNGQERETEINSGTYSATNWIYDSRLGIRKERDQIEEVGVSPYATFRNNPILNIDPDGNWPFENPFSGLTNTIKKRVTAFVKATAVMLVKATAQYVKEKVYSVIRSAKIEPKAEVTVSAGAQASGEIKKSAGFTRNLGSVDLFSIKVGAEFSAEGLKNTSEFKWIGKDGNIDVRQSLSQDLTIPTPEGVAGTGTEYENTATYHVMLDKSKLNVEKTNHTVSLDKGVSYNGVNVSGGIEQDIKEDETSVKGSVGVAGEVSLIIGIRGNAGVDVKVPYKKGK